MYVIVEFVSGLLPCLAEVGDELDQIASKEGISGGDLIIQVGPTIGSVTVWNMRTEKAVAVYHEMRSLVDMVRIGS